MENSKFLQYQNFRSFLVVSQFFLGRFDWFWVISAGFGSFWLVSGRLGSFRILVSTSSQSFYLSFAKNWQCKKMWLVVSVSAPQSHMGLTQSLKLWQNLCSLRWLNCSWSLVSNLSPTGSCIKNIDLWFKEKSYLALT